MTGTPSQIEWAEQIKLRVTAEFDRVASAFEAAASKQSEENRLRTRAIIGILEQKRIQVMENNQAGYFIREWQELRDQVRQLIALDPGYKAIRATQRPFPSSHGATHDVRKPDAI